MNVHGKLEQFLFIIGFTIFLIILTLFNTTLITNADTNPDYDNALSTAPKGLSWDTNAFIKANFKTAIDYRRYKAFYAGFDSVGNHTSSRVNNADIVSSTNPNSKNTSIIKMTNGTWQTGAIWSNKEQDNYFETDHEQKASMWLYFGKTTTSPGDGMAFVIQNDPNKENSIALSADGIPVNGQSLGVWGADWNYRNSDPGKLASSAIQNSWALEFDTFINYQSSDEQVRTGTGVAFDRDFSQSVDRHIAANYPALASTYISQTMYPDYYNPNYFVMKHQKYFIPNNGLVDSKWHHVSITWEPIKDSNGNLTDSGTLTYSYDDKNPDTGTPQEGHTTSFTIDTNNFYKSDGVTTPDKNDKRLYWGFTGSTGKNSENNLMIFESIPSYVDATADSTIYDVTQGKNLSPNDTVEINDKLKYSYNLGYIGWSKNWHDIIAKMNIPNNIKFSSGSVHYSDTDKTYPITDFSDPNAVTYTLPDALSHQNSKATIELDGKVTKPTNSDYTIPSAHASFDGDNLITSTETIPLSIKKRKLLLESNSPDTINLSPNENTSILGNLSYLDGSSLINSHLTIHYKINGVDQPDINLSDTNPATGFMININSNLLKKGMNKVSFFATDNYLNNTSNTIIKNIDVGGTVRFKSLSPIVSFQSVNTYDDVKDNNKGRIIPRSGDWYATVLDSRKKDSTWKVQVNATKMFNNDNKILNGSMVYMDKFGKKTPLDSSTVEIDSKKKDSDEVEETDVTKNWTKDSGILLDLGPNNSAGKYSGTINWILTNSI